ncbi:hypothetical protein V6000_002468 [Aspergillus fumigatus]
MRASPDAYRLSITDGHRFSAPGPRLAGRLGRRRTGEHFRPDETAGSEGTFDLRLSTTIPSGLLAITFVSSR